MTSEEYFGDWMKVIDKQELLKIMKWLQSVDLSTLCPLYKDIFKTFRLCKYKDCKAIFVGQDPYPQPGVATGVLFGNKQDSKVISPSLEIIKEAVISYELPHSVVQFDNTLESWAKQGILMLNSALTCQSYKIGSHTLIWRPFIKRLLQNISSNNFGLLFVLFGKQAQSFKDDILGKQHIIEVEHPAYFARKNKKMPYSIFRQVKDYFKRQYNKDIKLYQNG